MRVFVACSASEGVDNKYKEIASSVSTFLARRGDKLVFGGSDEGMMGKCYMTFKYEGGKTKAVCTLKDAPVLDMLEVDAYEVKQTTVERTLELYKSCEAALFLPGGIGTLAELFSMIDEKRTSKDTKEIIIFNYDNFFNPIINYLKKLYENRFITKNDLQQVSIVSDIKSLEMYLNEKGNK